MAKLVAPARVNKLRFQWIEAESRMRASFLATRRLLAPFLVKHRFEGNQEPEQLTRSKYGYGIALNKSYVTEIMGHVRSAPNTREWGALATGKTEPDGTPAGGLARDIYNDCTGKGVPLRDFMELKVLEWLLTSVGGFVVVDTPPADPRVVTAADEKALGKRPFFRFIPFSAVEDLDTSNLSWIKFCEEVDNRDVDGDKNECDQHHIVYSLDDSGNASVARYNKEGESVDAKGKPSEPVILGRINDAEGRPILPLIAVRYGDHPELSWCGTGLLYGLDDIVIDLFNVTSEMREAYRDAAFGMLVHKGPEFENVKKQLDGGTRLAALGDDTNADLARLQGDSAEVASGITLIELGVKNWALSAKRQAAEAMGQSGGARNNSGVALTAEFQLDLKPLLVNLTKALDTIESNALYVAAQMAGVAEASADKLKVTRGTEFRLEDEASRIARLCAEFTRSLKLSPAMSVELTMKWLESANIIDLTEMVDAPKPVVIAPPVDPNAPAEDPSVPPKKKSPVVGSIAPKPAPVPSDTPKRVTLGDRIRMELEELFSAEQASAVAQATSVTVPFPLVG